MRAKCNNKYLIVHHCHLEFPKVEPTGMVFVSSELAILPLRLISEWMEPFIRSKQQCCRYLQCCQLGISGNPFAVDEHAVFVFIQVFTQPKCISGIRCADVNGGDDVRFPIIWQNRTAAKRKNEIIVMYTTQELMWICHKQ